MAAKLLESPAEVASDVPQPLLPATVIDILAVPDEVEVMSLTPVHADEDEDGNEIPLPDGPNRLFGHIVRGTARVPTAERRRAVADALVVANREGLGWALCFDPHYAVRVSRGGQSVVFLICFWCGNARVVGPSGFARTYPFGWSAAKLLRRELRRGIGWLRFWRWLL